MKIRALRTLLSLLFLAGAVPILSPAQDTGGSEREAQGLEQNFLLRVWETADGLLPTNVRSITQTRDGYVWMASVDGFVRFDGVRAVLYSGKISPGLPTLPRGNRVFADSKGLLWATSTDGRIFSFDQINWREYRAASGWPGFVVESIDENSEGRLVFSGAQNVVEFSGGKFTPVSLPELPANFRPPLRAMFDARGKLFLSSPTHLFGEEKNGWSLICSAASLGSGLHGVAPARGEGLWVATESQIRKYVGDTATITFERGEGFQSEDLVLLEDFHGNLWAGSPTKGLRVRMPDGSLVRAGRSADSLPPQISCLFEDREHNVLVGTNGAGIARFKPRPFTAWLGRLGGLAGTLVNSIGEDPPGRILVGTEGSSLRRIGGGAPPALVSKTDKILARQQRVSSLLLTREGEMIAAVVNKGLFRIEGDSAVEISTPSLQGQLVRALFEDSQGRLWIGHDRGITVRDHGNFIRFPNTDVPVLTNVRAIAEGADGSLWFAGKEGLARSVTGKDLQLVTIPDIPPHTNFLSLFVDHVGVLWVGAESKGIIRWENGHAFLFTTQHGLPITSPGAFLEDGDYLWASGEKGIVRMNRASLEAVATGRPGPIELQLFNRADGLPSDACRRGYQPSMLKASDGRLWFATHKGAISVSPQEITTARYEPPATIEEIRAETQAIAITPANRKHIDIPAGTRHMTIRCSVPSLGKPDYARFQYTLQGAETGWLDAGNERVIRFYDLPPGKYRFVVRAIGTDGRFVQTPTEVTFFVHPFFWQRLSFRALCLLLLLGAVAYIVWRSQQGQINLREERLRAQESRAELEMQLQQAQKMEALGRLAGGIAHDFNNLLTSVGGNAELLGTELPPQSRQREIVTDIATAAGRARELVSQILTFSRQRTVEKVALDPVPVFREAVQLLRAGLPAMIELVAEVPEKLPAILGDAAQIQRIVMNLGTNSAQAIGAKGGHIWIGAEESSVTPDAPVEGVPPGHYLHVRVRDDGRGMDDATRRRIFDPFFTTKAVGQGTGLGLSVVHGIVQEHGGHITVESQPSVGTVFQIYLPVTDQTPAPSAASAPAVLLKTSSAPSAAEKTGVLLVVDDEAVVLKVSRAMLERLGYTVEAHTDAATAIAAFSAAPERYRLLLTDFAMPKLDGVKFAQRIWGIRPDLPAILYTGYGGKLTSRQAEQMGFAELLAKPFNMQTLEAAVARALKSPESPAVAATVGGA